MSPTNPSIYNATDGPLAIDRAGRMLAAGETREDVADLEESPLAGHISADRITVVEVTDDSSDGDAEQPTEQPTTARTRKGRATTQES